MVRLRRIGAIGLTAAVLAWAAVHVSLRLSLGDDPAAAMPRIERQVREALADIDASLRAVAESIGTPSELIQEAGADPGAARALFDRLSAALTASIPPGASIDRAVTIYNAAALPLAWSGRPSELPVDRTRGPQALFVAPGRLGLRLVYVHPIAHDGRRVGTTVVEQVLASTPGTRTPQAAAYVFGGAAVPVAVRARFEGAGESATPGTFVITGPSDEPMLEAHVSREELERTFAWWRTVARAAGAGILALTLLCMTSPVLDLRDRAKTARAYLLATLGLAMMVAAAWLLVTIAVLPLAPDQGVLSGGLTGPGREWLNAVNLTPPTLLALALAAAALVALAADAVERGRRARMWRAMAKRRGAGAGARMVAASVVGAGLLAYQAVLRVLVTSSPIDVLHFSLHPPRPARLMMVFGFVFAHAAVIWASIVLLRWSALVAVPASNRRRRNFFAVATWSTIFGVLLLFARQRGWLLDAGGTAIAMAAAVAVVLWLPPGVSGFRRGSQARRLGTGFLLLLMPALVFYPTIVRLGIMAERDLIEREFARQVLTQREDVQLQLARSLVQIDRLTALPDLVNAPRPASGLKPPADLAFQVWSQTELGTRRLTSAVELYGPDGWLVSRFALNLPELSPAVQTYAEPSCSWETFEEVAPLGAEERRLLHAGRGICQGATRLGSIVVHVMPDYNALPFISSQSPYFEAFRGNGPAPEGVRGRAVEFAVYGWSLSPLYSSPAAAWPVMPDLFAKIARSRDPFWTELVRGGRAYDVYFFNDRAGIYALGYPAATPTGHLLNIADIVVLTAVVYALTVAVVWLVRLPGGRSGDAARLLRELRASFYRKLFLLFVLAAVVPVLTLAALARVYVADQLQADIEASALATASVAQRVIEDYRSRETRGETPGPAFDDDVLVALSRVIGQDVNLYEGPHLVATSERDLFESGLLPTRTPAASYRAIVLGGEPSFLHAEQVGRVAFLVAATPVRSGRQNAILTVPLGSRQPEIERERDELDRRILLAAVAFVLLGAFGGYWLAERIADPVNRLTRATRRIARGNLEARIAATSSDELGRLVEDFNSMAAELRRQRAELERTNRLAAWAEMARQVAHDIKNPLTPIQLSAEHLIRVHVDRGRPLSPVLEGCVDSILSQVALLRQLAAEFSSFGSSPTPQPAPTPLGALLDEVLRPYRAGLHHIDVAVTLPPDLPPVHADRVLLARALTNVLENALHAMPGGGRLAITAGVESPAGDDCRRRHVWLRISDTGVGMDQEALERAFEPYFSTKASGTGLGLTIARRNVELLGGTIGVESRRGVGTTVTLTLPVA